jgi:hypothetical protein
MKKNTFLITSAILFVTTTATAFFYLNSYDDPITTQIVTENVDINTINSGNENATNNKALNSTINNIDSPDDDVLDDNEAAREPKEASIRPIADDQYGHQDQLPNEIMEQIFQDINDDILNTKDIGGISEDGRKALSSNNLKDTISINDLPPAIASAAKNDLEFREKYGFDKTSESVADEILTAIGQISGTEYPIPNLEFELSKLPHSFSNIYQYLGYIYPYQTDGLVGYTSIKRVFSHVVNNSILVINETSLKNGGATLTSEFVNSQVHDCPAMIVEKRDDSERKYGQINWNTNLIGYTIYQFNIDKSTSGLLAIADSIAIENSENINCVAQDEDRDNIENFALDTL